MIRESAGSDLATGAPRPLARPGAPTYAPTPAREELKRILYLPPLAT
jgi:hypothetical protein